MVPTLRRTWFLLVVCFFVTLLLTQASPVLAVSDRDWGRQGFSPQASEKYGVRGCFKTVNAGVVDFHHNFTSSVAWIVGDLSGFQAYVEVGFTKGVNEWHDVSAPSLYFTFNPTGYPEDQATWCDNLGEFPLGSAGTLHKYAVSRVAHDNNSGQTRWTYYFDGDAFYTQWMDEPDQGHPLAGGETYQTIAGDSPVMNAQGRNNGTSGDSSYWCFKNSSNDWYRWDPSHAANTIFNEPPLEPDPAGDGGPGVTGDSAITFSSTNPQYSHFTAGE